MSRLQSELVKSNVIKEEDIKVESASNKRIKATDKINDKTKANVKPNNSESSKPKKQVKTDMESELQAKLIRARLELGNITEDELVKYKKKLG